MKLKRRRVVEVPPKIRSFINNVKGTSLDNIEEPLKNFSWEYDKGDFHHWVELFNHFDSYFERHVKPRKDLLFEDNFLEADSPFPREAVLEILRVTRIILENCTNKHFYSSFEQYLSSLLACTDADVVESSLKTLAAFLKKTVGKCTIRDSNLTSKLFAFSQGWGSKEEGLGLIACSIQDGCDSVATRVGSTLHFEFYADSDTSTESCSAGTSNKGLQVIHLPNIKSYSENDLELLHKLVKEYKVPPRLCFSLFSRLRFTRAFSSLAARQQYVCMRLYAFIVLVQASNDGDDLSAFFNNEPEFVSELVSLLTYEDSIPEKIRILGILSLAALCHDRSHQPTVLTAVSSGGHRGILPGLMQKAIDSITSETGKWSVGFAEALLSLVTVLVSSSPGSSALREAGFIPTLLPLLKDTKPQHIHLVSTAVLVLEAFMDYSNPAVALFRDLGGLDDTIARLKLEVSYVEKDSKKHDEDSLFDRKGKQTLDSSPTEDSQLYYSEAMVSYHRKLLMKALLGAISLGTYAPGTTDRIYGSEENLLLQCLCIIFRRAKDFGGGVFSLAATVMSDLIHKDPTCFSVLDAAGLPQAFLDSIMTGVLSSAEAITCIPQCLDALCLNNSGLLAVKNCNALRCFVKIFTSRTYLRALSGDTSRSLSSGLDELIRHASSLRSSAVDIFVEILNTILKIGSGTQSASSESQSSSTLVSMETDLQERNLARLDEAETSKIECSEQIVEGSSDTAINVENFLPECISNATRLLETVLQNGDTCRLFIERKGIESVLELFNLPLMPLFASIGQNIAVAFKNFSPMHSITVARAVCSFLKEHLKSLNELLASIGGANLLLLEAAMQMKVLRSLSSLEDILSLSNFLLKATTTMVSEFGSSDADVLKDLGKTYKEILWQISLCNDSKIEEKQGTEQETGSADGQITSTAGRESDDDANVASVHRHLSPFSVRSGSASQWSVEQEFLSVVRSAEGLHRHGRHGLSRTRGGRTSRYLDTTHSDSESSANVPEASPIQDVKKKSPDVLISELVSKLGCALRSFHASLVKGLTARRRSDHGSLSPACKNLATALAKLFLEALSYSGQATTVFEMSLSVKCRYLGKVVDDMVALIFDSRRRSCNTALVNSFYVSGTFKELLTTFEATSQLLWTLPHSLPTSGLEQGKIDGANRSSQSSWLLDTLQSYCCLLVYFVNSSLLLSPSSPSHAQLLVQPVAAGLSIGLFEVPRDPEVFVQMLQTQVLDVILPIWNNPMFSSCSPAFISSVVSIVTHIYSGVGDLKNGRNGITGNVGQRFSAPPLDETSIASIVEMGFTRARAEEALRSIGTNSVEMAMDWLFSHPEEYAQEDVQLAQALELSLGGTSDVPKDDNNDNKVKNTLAEKRGAEVPSVDDILSASMKLFRNGDAIAFPLTDLLVTLCNRNKGTDCQKVVLFLIQQLKVCPLSPSTDTGALGQISHILALLLSEETSTRQLAAENGVVTIVLDILTNFMRNGINDDMPVSKCLSTLFLILNNMMQTKTRLSSEDNEGSLSGSQSDLPGDGTILSVQESVPEDKTASKVEKDPSNVFENILGKSTGYLTLEESRRVLELACKFIKMHVPAVVMQAVLQLCARLTKTHVLAVQFLDNKCSASLFNLPSSCFFPGFDSLASAIIRHLLEDPQTLQTAMELEIRQTLSGTLSRNAGRLSPRLFLTSMAPVISRDPVIFMKAAAAVCQLDSSGGRTNIVLTREKEKEKPKSISSEGVIPSNDCVRISESRTSDQPGKCSRSHKKVPASLSQVIDELLEIIMRYPSLRKHEDCLHSLTDMDVEESTTKEKGKSKMDGDIVSEKSACLARVTFVLKLLSDILLMYVHAVGVVLRRDVDACQPKGLGMAEECTSGVVHHVLHQLLPLSSDKECEASNEWKGKLSEKASWFLVVLCGRSGEGRKRVIGELVKAFSSFTNLDSNFSTYSLVPNKKVFAFTDLVYSILSKNSSSSSLPGSGCSPDIAKTMIDGGIVQSLTIILQVIDLDHPDAPKVVNLILKALEILTRAANASDQLYKSDGVNKKKPSASAGRSEDLAVTFPVHEVEHDQNVNFQNDNTHAAHIDERQVQRSSQEPGNQEDNGNQSMEQDTITEREDNIASSLPPVRDVEFMHEEIDGQDVLHNTNSVAMSFQVEHRTDDDMADEDDDMGEDADDDDDDDDEDDDEDIAEEGAALMSLADTDAEDHDENGLGDEYNDEMIDEDDDDFPENRVIEVRWREGLTGLDQLRVLRGSADANRFIDIAAEPFRGVNADDLFHFRRPLGIERRRHNGRSFLGRSSLESNGFQHPLLIRPPQSGDPSVSSWQSAGNVSRDLESLSPGTFDLAHFYMYDNGIPSDYSGATLFGDRLAGAAPPPLIDFSMGVDSLHVGGRRGPGDGRWSDDGQPQPGAQGAAIAQAVEDRFVSHMRSMVPDDSSQAQRQFDISTGQEDQQQNAPLSDTGCPLVAVDDVARQQSESPHQEMTFVSGNQQGNLDIGSDLLLPNASHVITDTESAVGEAEDGPRATRPTSVDVQNNSPIGHDNMHIGEGVGSAGEMLDTVPEVDVMHLSNVNLQMQEDSEVSADLQVSEHPNRCNDGPLGTESHSSGHAVIDSGCAMAELSDGHAGPLHGGTDIDMNGAVGVGNLANCSVPVSIGEEEALPRENTVVLEEGNQVDSVDINNDSSASHSIDPTFLEALPEDLRAEVLASQQASQQAQPVPDATYAPPPPEEIDPEFLAALPPDIQAEVLAQQRAQRFIHSQQAVAEGPVDMDNASILATFPPDLREEVLLTSPDTVLSSLPSNFLAEAQILRDRAATHYHARSSLFGGSHRLGGRRLAVDRQGVMDRGVGITIGRRAVSGIASNLNVKEVEGIPLMDTNALRALIRLLRLAQPLGKGLLQRLLLNLCAHTTTRATLVFLLLDMIKLEADECVNTSLKASQRLYGCQCNVVYGLSQPSDGLPPLVSRRVLELLTYLATNHFSVSNLLFYFDHSLNMESPSFTSLEQKNIKGKAKVSDMMVLPDVLVSSWKEQIPLLLFLKLLNKPLFLRSSVHLEQAMCLLQVVVNNVVSNIQHKSHSVAVPTGENSKSQPENAFQTGNDGVLCDSQKDNPEESSNLEMTTNASGEPCYSGKRMVNPFDILLKLPECDLHNLCSLLAHEGLSDKVYSLAAEVVKKLAFAAVPHRKFFSAELANLAHGLSVSAVNELITLRSTEMLGLSAGSMAGAAILRVLQTLSTLTSTSEENKSLDIDVEQQSQSILWNLNTMLEPLWQELSDCISATETKLGQNSTLSSPVPIQIAGDLVGVSSSSSPPLPPGAQRLLPFIEAFFVLCEKLQISQSIMQADVNATAREVKESAGGSSSPSPKNGVIGTMTFARVVEKHRRLLNAFIRQNPGLLEKSLSMMLKLPRLIDFDNKRAYFRSRIRQQHDQHPSAPLRVSVRRAYVLEDSYNQLRMRSNQDLKGRLTVQFQGEEGIDAGGLTREWYQLLSRVIFDKGALLFTTVGNNATFQPNPNSVYQTEHLSYFKFVGRVVAKALFDGQLLDVYFTRSFYKHILGVKVTYHDIEAVDPDYYKNLKWMLENDVSDIPDLTFSMDPDEEKHILYEKTEVTDYELKPGGRNTRVTEETKHEYVDLVAEHILSTAIRPQINSFLEGFNELIPRDLISIFNDKELELLISGLPEIDFDDLKANTEYTGYTAASSVVQWFWDVVKAFNKEDMARFLQFVTGTSKVPLEGFKALQGISGPQRFQIHKAYGAPERLPSAHTCFNQLDLPEYSSKQQLEERLLLAIHEASEGFGFG